MTEAYPTMKIMYGWTSILLRSRTLMFFYLMIPAVLSACLAEFFSKRHALLTFCRRPSGN